MAKTNWKNWNKVKLEEDPDYFKKYRRERKLADPMLLVKAREYQVNFRAKQGATINAIRLHYGCVNPSCAWSDELHTYPAEKQFTIGGGNRNPLDDVIAEINKCIVLCHNCHREHHFGKLDISGFRRCNIDKNGQPVNYLPLGDNNEPRTF
jgi:hypothetical protein